MHPLRSAFSLLCSVTLFWPQISQLMVYFFLLLFLLRVKVNVHDVDTIGVKVPFGDVLNTKLLKNI